MTSRIRRGSAAELEDAVRRASAGTPYAVVPAEDGFDVRLDLADERWWGAFDRAGLRTSMTHEVRVRGDRFVITDVARTVKWVAGVPRIAASAAVERGRIKRVRFQRTYALGDDLRLRKVADESVSLDTGRHLVEEAAAGLGLRQAMPVEQKIALALAGVAVGGLVVVGIAALVLWLAGVR